MFTTTLISTLPDAITLALAGNVDEAALVEIRHLLEEKKEAQQEVVMDLGEVTLIDRAAARFFAEQFRNGMRLLNCPPYIQRWIGRETTHE